MRILHITSVVHPSAGGPPVVAINLASAQARYGHSVAVLGHYPPGERAASELMFKDVPFDVPVGQHLLPLPGRLVKLRGQAFRHTLRSLLPEVDIVEVHGFWSLPIVQATRLAHAFGVPYIVRPAGMLDPWSLGQKRRRKKLSLLLRHGAILRRAAFIHATSKYEAANIERVLSQVGSAAPVHVIPNGVFLQDIESMPPRGGVFGEYPALQGKPYIFFLGRLHHKKRPRLLIEAFALIAHRFPNHQLVIAGPDGGELAPLQQLIIDHNLQGRVHLPGPVYHRQKFQMLVDAACFCLPSEQENFGVAVAEAMAAATPVVISDQVQIWPSVKQWGAGVVVPVEQNAVADALARVLEDEPGRLAMGDAGRRLVLELFLWRNIAKLSLDYYTRVLSDESPPPAWRGALA